jgi:hypothetical protein
MAYVPMLMSHQTCNGSKVRLKICWGVKDVQLTAVIAAPALSQMSIRLDRKAQKKQQQNAFLHVQSKNFVLPCCCCFICFNCFICFQRATSHVEQGL